VAKDVDRQSKSNQERNGVWKGSVSSLDMIEERSG